MKLKRTIARLLAVVLLLSMLPLQPALAAKTKTTGTVGGNIRWSYSGHTLTLSGKGALSLGEDEDDYPWAVYKKEIKKLVLKKGVTEIPYGVFTNYKNLKTIAVAETVKDLSCDALKGTAWYRAQPKGPLYLKHLLLGYKGKMPKNFRLQVKDGTTAVSGGAMYGQQRLTEVTLPDSVIYLGEDAFRECPKLDTLHMSENVCEIGMSCFDDTAWIQNQPEGLVYLGKVAYQYHGVMQEPTTLRIKEGTVSVSPGAFVSYETVQTPAASKLVGVKIPDSVKSIGYAAFAGTGLKAVMIPKSVSFIGAGAFDCFKLEKLVVDPGNKHYASDKRGCLYNKAMTKLLQYPINNEATTYTIPKTITFIPRFQFEDCNHLQEIRIHKKVRIIQPAAFTFCSALTKITVSAKNPYFSSDQTGCLYNKDGTVFLYHPEGKCKAEPVFTIPKQVKTIGERAFWHQSLRGIRMSDSVTTVLDSAFAYCENLATVRFSKNIVEITIDEMGETAWYMNLPDGPVYIGKVLCGYRGWSGKTPLRNLNVKAGTATIAQGAFWGNDDLESVKLPKSVKTVHERAFAGCDQLQTVRISNPKCSIEMQEDTFPQQAKLYAAAGSTAQAYAEQFGRTFVAV